MDAIVAIYQTQPWWLWFALGALILAVEAAAGTEWLLWPAVSAVLVALLTLVAPGLSLPVEIGVFAALTLVTTLGSRKLIKRVQPGEPDINDRDTRLIGQRARVVSDFVGGHGRVFISGAEWPAQLDGAEAPAAGESVVVEAVAGSRLVVRGV